MSAAIALNFLVLLLFSGQIFGQDDAETTTTTPAPIVIKSFLVALLYRIIVFTFQSIKHKVSNSNSSNNNNSGRHMVVGSVAVECAVVWVDDAAKIEARNATCSKSSKDYLKLKIQSKKDIPPRLKTTMGTLEDNEARSAAPFIVMTQLTQPNVQIRGA